MVGYALRANPPYNPRLDTKLDSAEPDPRALARLLRLDLAIARGCAGMQRGEQPPRRDRHFLDGAVERGLVGLRGPAEAGQLAHELQRRGADLVLRRRRFEIEQG